MQRILAHPEWYPARRLPTPFEKRLSSGEAYLLVTPKVSEDCSSEAALRDIALASNIVDDLEVMSHFYEDSYSSCFLGSKYGYLINADVFASDEEYQRLHSEEFHTVFDPRERPWYQVAAAGGKTAFTDVYVGNDGSPELTCAAPYYDADGLAGVVGIDVHLPLLYDLVADKSLGSTNVNFALNSKGEILFSTETEGILAVGDGHRELDKSSEESLALAAAGMKAGLSDIVLVTMDGEEYYLAYVPLPSLGYSFGTMLKREEVLAPVALARDSLSAHADAFHSSMRSLFLENTVKIFLLALVLFGLFFYGSRRMAKQFVQPILTLTEAVREIAKGNLDRKTDIRTGDEIEELSDSVNHMTGELKEYMENLAK